MPLGASVSCIETRWPKGTTPPFGVATGAPFTASGESSGLRFQDQEQLAFAVIALADIQAFAEGLHEIADVRPRPAHFRDGAVVGQQSSIAAGRSQALGLELTTPSGNCFVSSSNPFLAAARMASGSFDWMLIEMPPPSLKPPNRLPICAKACASGRSLMTCVRTICSSCGKSSIVRDAHRHVHEAGAVHLHVIVQQLAAVSCLSCKAAARR